MIRNRFVVVSMIFVATAAIGGSRPARCELVLLDDFESYTDEASFQATWGAPPMGAGSLDMAVGHGGQSLFHPAGAASNVTSKRVFTPTVPTEERALVWEFDLLDDGRADKSFAGGLRDNGAGAGLHAILDMGRFIHVIDPEKDEFVSGYAVRTALIGGDPRPWFDFRGNPPVEAGWHHFTATILPAHILFELDLQADGHIDGAREIATTLGAGIAYNLAQFGGPENLFSPGGGGNFDNLRVSSVSTLLGDMDGNGQVDFDDLAAFQLGIGDPIAYRQRYRVGPFLRGDMNGDGDFDFDDITGFQALFLGGGAAVTVPEPGGGTLACFALVAFVIGRSLGWAPRADQAGSVK